MNRNQISFFCTTSLVLILLFLQSCDKHHAKKLAGVYHCKVHYHYEDIIIPTSIDSFYNSDLIIEREGKYLYIFDYKIHVDSLWKAPSYKRGYVHDYLNVLFEKDSVFVLRGGGGLGGNSYRYYKGKK